MNKIIKVILLMLIVSNSFSQVTDTTSKWNYSIGSDIVSRYVWRGSDYNNSPAIQPTAEISYKNFAFGAWGSYTFANAEIQEADLYLSYSFWKIKMICYDYFYMNMNNARNSYFTYNKDKTGHDFSLDTEFLLSEKFPLKILISYNFYGADTLQSAYFETSYKLTKNIPLEIFVGYTPYQGWYGNDIGVVNTGICMKKEYKLLGEDVIPIYFKLIFNPQSENIYIVAGITF